MLTSSCSCLQYEPELFPGLIYRMKVPKIVLLIFVSGKVVLTGVYHATCIATRDHSDCSALTLYLSCLKGVPDAHHHYCSDVLLVLCHRCQAS